MDELGKILKVTGYRIAEVGCSGEPVVAQLAAAAHTFAPVAAAVFGSSDEPEVARCRAFAHITRAAELLSPSERQALAVELDHSTTSGNGDEAVDGSTASVVARANAVLRLGGGSGAPIPA